MVQFNKENITELNTGYVKEHHLQQKIDAKRKRGLYRRLAAFLVIFSVLAFAMLSTITSQMSTLAEKGKQEKQLKSKLAQTKEKKAQLKEEAHKLKDVDYIGEIARRDLFMSKKGEIVFKTQGSSSD
ncbi:FtsB family cell division protein [Fictibacillus fluitans]|uniref:Septum formation initiator family protein n=1 Tax=Fictibacillus fluitans TaxID=3058422 RepID=A0ABT8I358_9BACL|nr:septum formation initiator family protein [Fictibacillus sp. NE201]MDN4527457.1 septum formation initiator family protein [Fictibacillus sp. NE201]